MFSILFHPDAFCCAACDEECMIIDHLDTPKVRHEFLRATCGGGRIAFLRSNALWQCIIADLCHGLAICECMVDRKVDHWGGEVELCLRQKTCRFSPIFLVKPPLRPIFAVPFSFRKPVARSEPWCATVTNSRAMLSGKRINNQTINHKLL
jgi:hypothetical protein